MAVDYRTVNLHQSYLDKANTYLFSSKYIDDMVWLVMDILGSDPSRSEIENQIDDANNHFRSNSELYKELTCFIIAFTMMIQEDDLLNLVCEKAFHENGDPAEGTDNDFKLQEGDLDTEVARMQKAILLNPNYIKIRDFLMHYFLDKDQLMDPKDNRAIRMRIMRGIRLREIEGLK